MKSRLDELGDRFEASGADPAAVAAIIDRVREQGDAAIRALTLQFDGVDVPEPRVPAAEIEAAWRDLPAHEQRALERAARNIETFALAQRGRLDDFEVEIEPGVVVGQRVMPVARAACYAPGGRYPLPSTVLMTVIPAVVAGVQEVLLLSPPGPNGRPHRHVLAAARLAGATGVLAIGGVQAVAAVALGTESIQPVDLIVGPGNAWVTEAKRQLYGRIGIDALAGPSEVLLLADRHADPARVAADMLAQAEHDPQAEAIALTDSVEQAAAIRAALGEQLTTLSTATTASASLAAHGAVIAVSDLAQMIDFANRRAPEHLHLHLQDAQRVAPRLTAYGAIFVGDESAEVFGDYCSGSNHVLPTGGAARYTGGLSVHTFIRLLAHQRLTADGAAALAPTVATLARVEGLEAHARAAEMRRKDGGVRSDG